MRRRTRDTLTAFLFLGGIPAAVTAPWWVRPRWLGLAIAVIGWMGYAYFILGQWVLFWVMARRPVAKRPWVLGGSPNPSPPQDG
jgi:hypothetical protein